MLTQRSFSCAFCGRRVNSKAAGTKHRNHCPYCLHSVHVDNRPGDRIANCGGLMKPIGKTFKPDGEEMVVHRCEKCGITKKNRIAGDDSETFLATLPVFDNDLSLLIG